MEINYESPDELGKLAGNFRQACKTLEVIVQDTSYLLGEMAEGNFNVSSNNAQIYIGNFRQQYESISKLKHELSDTLTQINEASEQVASGSGQLAGGAQALAEGATDQAGAVEELTATVESVSGIQRRERFRGLPDGTHCRRTGRSKQRRITGIDQCHGADQQYLTGNPKHHRFHRGDCKSDQPVVPECFH